MADETKPFLSSIPQTPPSPSSKNLPNFKQPTVGLKYIKNRHTFLFLTSLILGILAAHNSSFSTEVLLNLLCSHLKSNFISVIICTILITFLSTFHLIARSREVYLIEFSCYKPSDSEKCSRPFFMHKSISAGVFTSETLAFQKKILERSGLGDSTYLPQVLHDDPTNTSIEDARNEAKEVMFGAIDKLLERTKLNPNDIGILVVNCSVFNPNPSLSSMIVNHYKLRKNIASYNLGGMGCSAGLISIDLAQRLLQLGQPNRSSYALVVSTENMSLNWYTGNDKSMLVSNCIFRMGAAAILLSNKKRSNAKYKLLRNVIRTHMGSDNSSFSCITQREDSTGKTIGISLSKDLINVAGDALKTNITTLAPLVLPFSEQLLFMLSWVAKKVFKIKLYVPDFKLALEHFCIHAGGRAVLDEIEKNMQLSEWHMEPSRMTLYRFGNTSSSSLWYELAYSEAKGRVRKGDRVWQIAFGSGFKCNSAVWKALRSVNPAEEKHNPWNDEIHHFPVDIPKVSTF